VDANHRLANLVFACRGKALPRRGVIEAHRAQPVPPQLHADGALGVSLEEVPQASIRHATTGREPSLGLLELIAVLGVVEKVGEVREQIQTAAEEKPSRTNR